MAVLKLPVGGDPILGLESRRGSNVSMEPACYDKSPTSSSSPAPIGWTSRRSSWNSLSRAPSLKKKQQQSGERRSLLSGEGGSSSEEGEGGGGGGEEEEVEEEEGGLMEEDNASLVRTDSMSQKAPRHRRMESLETRSSMELPPDVLLQIVPQCGSLSDVQGQIVPQCGSLSDVQGQIVPQCGSLSDVQGQIVPQCGSLSDVQGQIVPQCGSLSDSLVSRLFLWLEKKQPDWCRQRDTWSMYLFPPESSMLRYFGSNVLPSQSHPLNRRRIKASEEEEEEEEE
ncbi:hypothetical protein F7725_013869 [Dissostichus mawsoni]|uniref:Uncharacterized protein n=1 Tax=Dissostichus mawsoni TaxID=36200 RepID=A0A7J5YWJ4_DISMA|nr:hypothetical protein F7725_013869 [Dissostichus mawsoni]